jgi:anti-sigma28 factor (negative regulator of flagellin synthesis)
MADDAPSTRFSGSLQAAAVAVAREPEPSSPEAVHEARLAELRRQVQDGTYRIDNEALAAKIVDKHLA